MSECLLTITINPKRTKKDNNKIRMSREKKTVSNQRRAAKEPEEADDYKI